MLIQETVFQTIEIYAGPSGPFEQISLLAVHRTPVSKALLTPDGVPDSPHNRRVIAAHLCLSGFVGNNWEEVVGSRTGIGFRPRRPSCCSEQAPVVKQFRCGYIRREWKRWLQPKLGLEGLREGWVNCRGELGG
ncbi:hypothetical protein QQF64_011006 [Cirrhinus molitorella]|uniref:Uncharacterized protein n=1 Tax=Cirrhinus molitorella TaxID=172907 RepID=A0ABR3LXZ6_9TELE